MIGVPVKVIVNNGSVAKHGKRNQGSRGGFPERIKAGAEIIGIANKKAPVSSNEQFIPTQGHFRILIFVFIIVALQQVNFASVNVKYLSAEIVKPDASMPVFDNISGTQVHLDWMRKVEEVKPIVTADAKAVGNPEVTLFVHMQIVKFIGWQTGYFF